jgi:TolA-binding protein
MSLAELKEMALKERQESDKAKADLEKQNKAKADESVKGQRGSSRPRSSERRVSAAGRAAAARLAQMVGKDPNAVPARPKRAAPKPAPAPAPAPTPVSVSAPPSSSEPEDPIKRIQAREDLRNEEYRDAIAMIRKGKLQEAGEVFRKLAIEVPSDRKYRVYMHYTWGRIHHSLGAYEDARVEYQRSLALEAGFSPALQSLDALPPDPNKKDGVFNKLFRK